MFYTDRLIVFSVIQTGQFFKLFTLSHSSHVAICLQLQNKTFGGLVRHITHSSGLNYLSGLIFFNFSSLFLLKASLSLIKASLSLLLLS